LLSKTVLLHHDNARPHAATATIENIQKLNFEFLPHPPYSPDLAPSDYHLFGSPKKKLWGRRFGSDEEVKQVVHTWLCDQQKTIFL
jgi:histone-lysine N-methyltransferase SETMAR